MLPGGSATPFSKDRGPSKRATSVLDRRSAGASQRKNGAGDGGGRGGRPIGKGGGRSVKGGKKNWRNASGAIARRKLRKRRPVTAKRSRLTKTPRRVTAAKTSNRRARNSIMTK